MSDRDTRVSPLTILGDGILLICAMAGFALSFLSLYGGERLREFMPAAAATPLDSCAAQAGTIIGPAVLFALAALCAWSLPRFRWAAGGLALLWGLLAFFNWDSAIQGGAVTVRTISGLFAQRVSWGRVFSYESGLTQVQEASAAKLFLVLALALLAMILGWSIVRARRWWLVLLFTLPPLLPGLLADFYPQWPPFLALAACWCVMLLTDLCKWSAPDRRGILTLAVLPCVAVVLAAITFAFPREGYTRPGWALEMETELHSTTSRLTGFFSQFDGPFHTTVTYVGAAEEADLAHAGPLNYSGRTVLRVASDYPDRLYLRGSSLTVYEDGVWKALPEGIWQEYQDALSDPDSAVSPLLFPSLSGGSGTPYTVTVSNAARVGACVYAPYFLTAQDWAEAGMLPVEDTYLARKQGQWSHTMVFEPLEPYGTGYMPAEANAYRSFVLAHYLDAPEEYRKDLARLCLENGVSDSVRYGSSYNPIQAAQEVAALLDELCEYDPETPAPPDGVDPVEYFLTESRRGYCMHFASAATLMLRSLGVPARYVSGFTAVPQAGRAVDVPDRAAHAWVEVWVDGFGWYPVEVTPAAAFTWYEQGTLDPVELPSIPPEESQAPEPTPTPSQEPTPSAAPSQGPQGSGGDNPGEPLDLTILVHIAKALAAVAGAAALVWLGQYLPKRFRAKRLSNPDRNRAALYGYGCLKRMERWGGRVDGRAVELVQKAKFSQHTLTQEELDELRALVDLERERLCVILDPAPRWVFRYLWGMPKRPKPQDEAEQPPGNGP